MLKTKTGTPYFGIPACVLAASVSVCLLYLVPSCERETIQKRVGDAYYSRSQKGFNMGSRTPYGFRTEPVVMQGINTKRLVPYPDEMENIKVIFDMYAQPQTSYGDIVRYFSGKGVLFYEKVLIRGTLAQILRNPVYVKADLDVYEFFKNQGTVIVNDASDFTGENGCYLYKLRETEKRNSNRLEDLMLVLAPHEGVIDSDLWLKCRKKLMNNMTIQSARKPTNTWLAGKAKCGRCGYGLKGFTTAVIYRYLRCSKHIDNKSCEGAGTIHTDKLEQFIYEQMVEKLDDFKMLTGKKKAGNVNPKLAALHTELAKVEGEIGKLVDSLTGANPVLLSYVNAKIEELDSQRQAINKKIADLSIQTISPNQADQISDYLDDWENVSFDDRRQILNSLVSQIKATSEKIEIIWKI